MESRTTRYYRAIYCVLISCDNIVWWYHSMLYYRTMSCYSVLRQLYVRISFIESRLAWWSRSYIYLASTCSLFVPFNQLKASNAAAWLSEYTNLLAGHYKSNWTGRSTELTHHCTRYSNWQCLCNVIKSSQSAGELEGSETDSPRHNPIWRLNTRVKANSHSKRSFRVNS